MRIAICEDMPDEARKLTDMLSHYLEANSLEADMDVFASGEEFLSAFAPGKYQIIFMDIYMKDGGVTGLKAAAKVAAADRDAAVVLVTNSDAHLHEGYSYALFYIVKPYDDTHVAAAMAKCWAQVERFAKTIEVVVDRQPVKIRLRDIYSVESIDHVCVFKLATHEITARMGFEGLADQLRFPFVRCHRSYFVNLHHAKSLDGNDFIMENGGLAPIGRNYKAEAQKAFQEIFQKRIRGDSV